MKKGPLSVENCPFRRSHHRRFHRRVSTLGQSDLPGARILALYRQETTRSSMASYLMDSLSHVPDGRSGCGLLPSAFITQISHRPVRSVRKAIRLPSGDQTGAVLFQERWGCPRSCWSTRTLLGVWVRRTRPEPSAFNRVNLPVIPLPVAHGDFAAVGRECRRAVTGIGRQRPGRPLIHVQGIQPMIAAVDQAPGVRRVKGRRERVTVAGQIFGTRRWRHRSCAAPNSDQLPSRSKTSGPRR